MLPLAEAKEYLFHFKGFGKRIVLIQPTRDLLIRHLAFVPKAHKELDQALELQGQSLHFLDPAEVVTIYKLEQGTATYYTTRRRHLTSLPLEADLLIPQPIAAIRFMREQMGNIPDAFLIDSNESIVWMEGGQVKQALPIEENLEALLARFAADGKKRPVIRLGEKDLLYATAIGAAFEAFDRPTHFLKNEFLSLRAKKRMARARIFSLALAFTVSLLAFTMYETKRSSHMKKLREEISLFYAHADAPFEEMIENWSAEIDEQAKQFPYFLAVPSSSDFFHWLSTHPLLLAFRSAGDPIEIKEVRYELVRYPHLGSSETKTAAKVSLTFSLGSPLHARKFHEALLARDPIVDSSQEIRWEPLSDGIRATFFLRNTHG
jgi:hypothetical protein